MRIENCLSEENRSLNLCHGVNFMGFLTSIDYATLIMHKKQEGSNSQSINNACYILSCINSPYYSVDICFSPLHRASNQFKFIFHYCSCCFGQNNVFILGDRGLCHHSACGHHF